MCIVWGLPTCALAYDAPFALGGRLYCNHFPNSIFEEMHIFMKLSLVLSLSE